MLVGHQEVVEALSSQLPPVSIINGPSSVGKRMIAAYAAIKNNVSRVDFTEVSHLTVDEASRVKKFMQVHPMQGLRFALINLDGASHQAMDKLLITLENPPSYARFSLISSTKVPRTLRTRAANFMVGLLEPEELMSILRQKGLTIADVSKLSKLGRVELAMDLYNNPSAKNVALNVFSAVESMDHILLMQAYKAVDEQSAKMMLIALEESASQSWKVFDPQYLGAFAKREVALKLLGLWSTVSDARPQLAMRVVLESVMKG